MAGVEASILTAMVAVVMEMGVGEEVLGLLVRIALLMFLSKIARAEMVVGAVVIVAGAAKKHRFSRPARFRKVKGVRILLTLSNIRILWLRDDTAILRV